MPESSSIKAPGVCLKSLATFSGVTDSAVTNLEVLYVQGKNVEVNLLFFFMSKGQFFKVRKFQLFPNGFTVQRKLLKWYYDKKDHFLFVFRLCSLNICLAKFLSFVVYLKAVYIECKFRISRSAITQFQK